MTAIPNTSPRLAPASAPAVSDDLWVTRLFSDSGATRSTTTTSPTAAYQDALYGRLAIVDLRTARSRSAEGTIGEGLATVIDPTSPAGYAGLLTLAASTPLVLIGDSAATTSRLAAHLTGLGLAEATVLRGGFAAWRSFGMPVD